jgi:hypothetical protein
VQTIVVLGFILLTTIGCAIHYYDPKTGAEHIWGFGHLKMKAAPENEGLHAVVRGTDVLGVSLGSAEKQAYLTVGWHRVQRLDIAAESTAIRLEWPTSDFVDVRIGSRFPAQIRQDEPLNDGKTREQDIKQKGKQP